MPSLQKAIKFATNSEFRLAQMRAYAWPIVRALYPKIECIGISGPEGKTTLLFANDKYITRDFIKFGCNPTAPLNAALLVLRALSMRLDGVFFELGANVGSESIEALNCGFSRAVLVEPEPRNASLLRSNIAINGYSDRATVVEVGVSNIAGSASMAISEDNRGDHKIAAVAGARQTTIELKTADQILIEAGFKPSDVSLVWIDTQGYDGFALAGAGSLIDDRVPFVMEFDPDAMKEAGCLDLALETISNRFSSIYDLSSEFPLRKPSSEISTISAALLKTGNYVDLLLV